MKTTMSNFSKLDSISKIIKNLDAFDTLLKNASTYHAHRKEGFDSETLKEHIILVNEKFEKLTEIHQLDLVIDTLIEGFAKNNFETKTAFQASQFIKKLFVNTIVFHDYGKINPNFQVDKMNNKLFKKERNSVLSSHHSSLGAYFFILNHFQEFSKKQHEFSNSEKMLLFYSILIFSYPIFKHHSKTLSNNVEEKINFDTKELEKMQSYLKEYDFEIGDFPKKIITQIKTLFEKYNILKSEYNEGVIKDNFPLYALLKLNFSLLTASDYLATGEYMNGLKLENEKEFGVLKREEVEEIYKNMIGKNEGKGELYNKTTYQNLDTDFGDLSEPNNENLNKLRQKMAIEVINKVRQNADKNLFYIEAPTGGGKTNLSMLAAMELLKENEELNKVFYVFPFTTLVTQTYKSIKKTLGLNENQIVQLHSKAGLTAKESDNKTEENQGEVDADYGEEKKNYIDNLFINFPFCLMTHIKFFDILKTNEKETNYILHRLANSVVVIDELQAYNPQHWDKLIYLIKQYAQFFNIRFIIMSATLPKLSKIEVLEKDTSDFVYLLENAKTDYFQNENFGKRVSFNFDLLEDKDFDLEKLAIQVVEKSKEYAPKDFGKAKPKGSVYTIVEFIFKKSATDFEDKIKGYQKEKGKFFDKVFVLSGTILEHRRKYIINSLKNDQNRNKKILLITTQVVEAGVDIDIDLGFKNISLIDSDEQLAGRINRNVNKENCMLYLFDKDDASVLYGSDWRFQIINKDKKISEEDLRNILEKKDFDRLYNLVFEKIDLKNEDTMTVNFSNYKNHFQNLEFTSAHRNFQLIEQKNLSIFVPIPIPIKVENEKGEKLDEVFSKEELNFLEKAGKYSFDDDEVKGEEVFELYIDLIKNRNKDFLKQKSDFKILQGVMSKFIFSLFGSSKNENKVSEAIDTKKSQHGIYYLENYQNIYSDETGLDENALADMINDFI
ncbi:CRISPR-associated helicase Cas3' [Bernardetia sp. Wsw4-3y2]|uniref:CRISPR-associated helicase Cas3' n=1 Tax=Bernardetia sp. Wsw4-3y2 TaxID=3127471 RepID=UPI0030CCB9C6